MPERVCVNGSPRSSALRLRNMPASARPCKAARAIVYGPSLLRGGAGRLTSLNKPSTISWKALPGRLAVALVAHHQRIAGVEFLVQHVAAGELGADDVPGELVELVAVERLDRRRLPPALEAVAQGCRRSCTSIEAGIRSGMPPSSVRSMSTISVWCSWHQLSAAYMMRRLGVA